MEGYFKVHRKILESNIFDNPVALKVFIWCLAKATYKDRSTIIGTQIVNLDARSICFWKIQSCRRIKNESKYSL